MKESLAIHALRRERETEFLKVLAICQASTGSDKVGKTLRALLGMLLPEYAEEDAKKIEKTLKFLEKGVKKGAIKAIPMVGRRRRPR